MFNTDPTVPDWEKSPEQIKKDNQEAAESQNAQAWAEAFPAPAAENNPWLNANMTSEQPAAQAPEAQAMPQMEDELTLTPEEDQLTPEEQPPLGEQLPPETPQFEDPTQPPMPPVGPAPGANNELASTDNIVTNQLQEVWNNGQGDQSLTDAYDDLRGSFTADNIKTSADMVETDINDAIQENTGKSADSEANLAQGGEITPDMPPSASQSQVSADLYNLTASAGATAIGAQANAETAAAQLMQDNSDVAADATQRDLDSAKQTLEDIQSDIPVVGAQAEPGSTELQTAESVLQDAQQMVIDAQESLKNAQKQAEERQEFINEHQEEVKDLQDQGVEMDEINQAITETGSLDTLQEDTKPEGAPAEDDDELEPRQSIFG